MAAQKKRTTVQGRKQTGKKQTGRTPKSNPKENGGPDLLTIVVLLAAIVLVIALLHNYKKEEKEISAGGGTTTVAPEASKSPEQSSTVPSQAVVATKPPVTGQPTATPTPTNEPVLSVEEARRMVEEKVELAEFRTELLDDHLMIDGEEYYTFCVNDANGETMEPLLIVEKKKGTLFCYDMSGVMSEFTKFPLDKTETGSTGVETISEEEARAVLAGYSKERLGLAMEVASYEMEVDAWTTTADGRDCYGINLFEATNGKKRLRGTFYVAMDGSAVYSRDEITGEIVER